MGFDTSRAVTAAANAEQDATKRQEILGLSAGQITEDLIKPVIDDLLQRWLINHPTDPTNPIVNPLLVLESIRLAEAINQLEPLLPDTQKVLGLLPQLTQAILEAGTLTIDNNGLLNLVKAAGDMEIRPHPEAQKLLIGLALDCGGPLGSVYNRPPAPVSTP